MAGIYVVSSQHGHRSIRGRGELHLAAREVKQAFGAQPSWFGTISATPLVTFHWWTHGSKAFAEFHASLRGGVEAARRRYPEHILLAVHRGHCLRLKAGV
jgi:hypothetical protein